MSGDRDRDEVFERRMDWALREVAGGQQAPDVTARVLARHAAGDDGERSAATAVPARRSWLLAALFLLGLGVVFGVFLFERAAPDRSATGPQDAAPAMVSVASLAEIVRLPADVRAVELVNMDDAALAELVRRCPDLEHLRVFASMRSLGALPSVSITDAAFPLIGSLSRLRSVDLVEPHAVRGMQLKELERLPVLERIVFRSVDLDDESMQVLPRLPSLRELILDSCSALGEGAIAAIARCPGLRTLSLRATPLVGTGSLAALHALRTLVDLDLGGIQYVKRGVVGGGDLRFLDDRDQRTFGLARPDQGAVGQYLGGIGVDALCTWPKLQRIALRRSPELEATVGDVLRQNCPDLREVDLSHCPLVDDTTVASLLGLRSLRSLSLAHCANVSRFCVPLLLAAQQLREVDLSGEYWVSLEQAEQLLASGKRVTCVKPEDGAFNRAFAALQAKYSALLDEPRFEEVHTLEELDALPASVTHIELRGLGDRAAAALMRRKNLVGLRFLGDKVEPFTDAALGSLARLPALEYVELRSLPHATGEGLERLAACRALQTVKWLDVPADDRALAILPRLPALTCLELSWSKTFGDDGARSIAACKGLRQLELSSTSLTSPAIAGLGVLTGLETLGLADLPGLDDAALSGLATLTNLRRLNLRKGAFTDAGLQALGGMRKLQYLNLGENPRLTTASLLAIAPGVRELHLFACAGLDPAAGPLLRDRFLVLTELDVGFNDWVDDAALTAVLQAPRLERLVVRVCRRPTTACYPAILAANSLRELHATICPCLTDELERELAQQRPQLKVTRKSL